MIPLGLFDPELQPKGLFDITLPPLGLFDEELIAADSSSGGSVGLFNGGFFSDPFVLGGMF